MKYGIVLASALTRAKRCDAGYFLADLAKNVAAVRAADTRLRQARTAYDNAMAVAIEESNRALALHRSGEVVRDRESLLALLPCGEGI